jgi:PAS domain S-box-containing protein
MTEAKGAGRHRGVLPLAQPLALLDLESRILDLVDTAILAVDLAGHIIFANRAASTLYGWEREELVGSQIRQMMTDGLPEVDERAIAAAINDGQSWEGTFDVRRKDGETITVRVMDSPLYDAEGTLTGVVSAAMDAWRERATEQQLFEQTRTATINQFLTDIGTAIASSADYEEALSELGRSCVPFLADLCLIDVAEGSQVRRVVATHRLPSQRDLVEALGRRYSPDPSGVHPAVSALRSGQVAIAPHMSDEFLRATTRDSEHYAIVKQLNFQSYMTVPLVARGRTLGALTLISCDPARRFAEPDLKVAQEVAWRASLMLDNARLLSESTHVAQVLQASLLPPSLPSIPGMEVAARYVAFGAGVEVGGDFYDIFRAGYGGWVFVLGDVCGRGPEAAVVTGLIRHTLRTAVHEVRQPGQLLAVTNQVLLADSDDPQLFTTLLCGILRPMAGAARISLANAGHPSPIVLRANGSVEVPRSGDLIIGAFEGQQWKNRTLVLGEGDLLVAYTDGITEARRDGDFFGEERLIQVVQSARGASTEEIADRVIDAVRAFAGDEPSDDLALIALRALSA